jgi:hypothetical protein
MAREANGQSSRTSAPAQSSPAQPNQRPDYGQAKPRRIKPTAKPAYGQQPLTSPREAKAIPVHRQPIPEYPTAEKDQTMDTAIPANRHTLANSLLEHGQPRSGPAQPTATRVDSQSSSVSTSQVQPSQVKGRLSQGQPTPSRGQVSPEQTQALPNTANGEPRLSQAQPMYRTAHGHYRPFTGHGQPNRSPKFMARPDQPMQTSP